MVDASVMFVSGVGRVYALSDMNAGSSPASFTNLHAIRLFVFMSKSASGCIPRSEAYTELAQLVERWIPNPNVGGSNPSFRATNRERQC